MPELRIVIEEISPATWERRGEILKKLSAKGFVDSDKGEYVIVGTTMACNYAADILRDQEVSVETKEGELLPKEKETLREYESLAGFNHSFPARNKEINFSFKVKSDLQSRIETLLGGEVEGPYLLGPKGTKQRVGKLLAKRGHEELAAQWQRSPGGGVIKISNLLQDILTMSWKQGWVSCMHPQGMYKHGPISSYEAGDLVAYLFREGADKAMARILIRRNKDGSFTPEPTVYGQAEDWFTGAIETEMTERGFRLSEKYDPAALHGYSDRWKACLQEARHETGAEIRRPLQAPGVWLGNIRFVPQFRPDAPTKENYPELGVASPWSGLSARRRSWRRRWRRLQRLRNGA